MNWTVPVKVGFAAKWMRGLRSWDPHTRRSRLHGPINVAIQTIDSCNAACIMCPYSSTHYTGSAVRMSDELFSRVMHELHRAGTVKTICLVLQNEPLLDRRLQDRIRTAREVFGESLELVVVTHGGLLTAEQTDELRGVDRIEISIDAARKETYERIRPGLDYETVIGNVQRLIDRGDTHVAVKFVLQRDNEGEEREFARRWHARGAAVSIDRLCNRAGALDAFDTLWAPRPGLLRSLAQRLFDRLVPCCPLPFSTAYVLADGRMITCSQDWGPRDVVGDISTQSLSEIWNGDPINRYRNLLRSSRTGESLVCRDCSLAGRFWQW